MDQVDLMDQMDFSALLRPCGPSGPLKTIFTHLMTGAIPSFDFSGFSAYFCHKPSKDLFTAGAIIISASGQLFLPLRQSLHTLRRQQDLSARRLLPDCRDLPYCGQLYAKEADYSSRYPPPHG